LLRRTHRAEVGAHALASAAARAEGLPSLLLDLAQETDRSVDRALLAVLPRRLEVIEDLAEVESCGASVARRTDDRDRALRCPPEDRRAADLEDRRQLGRRHDDVEALGLLFGHVQHARTRLVPPVLTCPAGCCLARLRISARSS